MELDDVPVVIDRRKIAALLAYLAVNRWKHHRHQISALFWSDPPQPKAYSNLCQVRQAVGKDWILAGRDTIQLIAIGGLPSEQNIRVDMEIYMHAGQHNAASRQYELCRRLLRREPGVDPQPETRALYKQIRR